MQSIYREGKEYVLFLMIEKGPLLAGFLASPRAEVWPCGSAREI